MITYRPHHKSDIPFRVKWLNNPKVKSFLDGKPSTLTTTVEQEAWFSRYENNPAKYFLTICADNAPIGVVGLTDIDLTDRKAKLFIMIGEDDFRGQGLGKKAIKEILNYAFNTLDLHKVTLEVYKENIAAIHCYLAVGFQEVGILEDESFWEGQFHSESLMVIFQSQFISP